MPIYRVESGRYTDRYAVASYDPERCQFTSRDVPVEPRCSGFVYACTRTLDGLIGVAVRHYPTPCATGQCYCPRCEIACRARWDAEEQRLLDLAPG